MALKKEILRTCIVTRQVGTKNSLFRIVKYLDKVTIDLTSRAPGRGVYLSKSKDVILIAKKSKALERAFKVAIDQSIYDELIRLTS